MAGAVRPAGATGATREHCLLPSLSPAKHGSLWLVRETQQGKQGVGTGRRTACCCHSAWLSLQPQLEQGRSDLHLSQPETVELVGRSPLFKFLFPVASAVWSRYVWSRLSWE